MRAFIVLCVVAIASADKLGYNYQPVGHSSGGLSFSPGAAASSGGASNLGDATNSHPSYASASFGDSSPSTSYGSSPSFAASPSDGSPAFASPSDDSGALASPSSGSPSYAAPGGEVNKEFFTYSANDDDFNDPANSQRVSNALKQDLRVIFIKGPENKGLENAALSLAKHASEDHTAIYVLNKQADIGDLANKLNALRSNSANNKPEVHFVKYRTPEDAANAQKAIQGQYDGLGGQSQSHEGGVAPVINFASQAPVRAPTAQTPDNAYLPTSIFRRRI